MTRHLIVCKMNIGHEHFSKLFTLFMCFPCSLQVLTLVRFSSSDRNIRDEYAYPSWLESLVLVWYLLFLNLSSQEASSFSTTQMFEDVLEPSLIVHSGQVGLTLFMACSPHRGLRIPRICKYGDEMDARPACDISRCYPLEADSDGGSLKKFNGSTVLSVLYREHIANVSRSIGCWCQIASW